jgi:hypothetical protein
VIARSGVDDIGAQREAHLDTNGQQNVRSVQREVASPGNGRRTRRAATTKGEAMVTPINIPDDWDDNGLILFEEFCDLIRTPQRTVRDWRRRGVGPRWTRFQGVGRLYITVAEARRFLASATVPREEARSDG